MPTTVCEYILCCFQVEQLYEHVQSVETSPPVGLRRSYAQPTLQFITNWQKEQMVHTQLISPHLTVN